MNEEEQEISKEEPSALNIEPKYEDFNQDLNFDYVSKKNFFDELFFRQSRLFKMWVKTSSFRRENLKNYYFL